LANVTLKIKIDVASLDAELQKAVEKIRQQLEKIGEIDIQIPKGFNKDAGEVDKNLKKIGESTKKVGEFSKRDMGMFANQILFSSGVTGRLQGQLSNLATGLATGGAIGAAFAGASALISTLTENSQRWASALREAANNLVSVKDGMEGIKVAITPTELDNLVDKYEAISAAMKGMLDVVSGGRLQTEIGLWFASMIGALPDSVTINEDILEVLKEQKIQLQANKLVADAYAKSLGFDSFEAYKQHVKNEEEKKKAEDKALEEAKRRAEERVRLQDDLSIRTKAGMDKEIAELTLKYDRERELAGENHQILLQLEREFNQNLLQIRVNYARLEFDERIKFHQQVKQQEEEKMRLTRERYAKEMKGAIDLTKLEARLSNTRAEITQMEQDERVTVTMAALSTIQSVFGQHTVIFKAAAAAQAIINTIAAAQAALAPPPLGIGPVFGPALAAITIAAGMARVASIMATDIPGFFTGGFTGEGNRKEEKGIVHAGEYVFEQPLVSREPERFALLHNMLRSGVTLADMFNRLAVPSPALTLPGGVPAGAMGSGGGSTALLQSIDKTLKELTDKGNDKMEVVGEVRLKDQDIYISFKRGEKKMLKRGTVNG